MSKHLRRWKIDETQLLLREGSRPSPSSPTGSTNIRRTVCRRTVRPKIDELAARMDEQLPKIPGKSDLAGAIRYARSSWAALTRYLDDGRLEISNNAA